MHSQILSILGVSSEDSEQIIDDINSASIPEQDKSLLSEARKLTLPYTPSRGDFDCEQLRPTADLQKPRSSRQPRWPA